MNASENYQPETWVCGNVTMPIFLETRQTFDFIFSDPIGHEIRAPYPGHESVCVRVVDDFFNKIGVKTR